LVVNADDFGVSERINLGIARAHCDGIVTATSLMAVGRAFEHAIRLLPTLPTLDVGVHLTLVAEFPLLRRGSSLSGADGRFLPSAGAFTLRWLNGRVRKDEVKAEWSAQIERVLGKGLRISHLDSHQHVHMLPGLMELAWSLAVSYSIPFVRVPVEGLRTEWPPSYHAMVRFLGAAILQILWLMARPSTIDKSTPRFLHFLGFRDGGQLTQERLLRLLALLRPGEMYELMCHPGFMPDEPDLRRWGYRHEEELAALIDPSIRSEITSRNIQLCAYKNLP
jgi:predicted glycoside hydrolase/deacetylase ChbG (UPF0249 family)